MRITELMTRLTLALAALAATSVAQAERGASRPDAAALPTKLQYRSAISAYQGYTDQPVQSWREANDQVGRIGGWRAYAREKPEAGNTKQAPERPAHPGRPGGTPQ